MRTAALLIIAALALTACGKQGALERPDPMFGKPPPQPPAEKSSFR